LRLTQIAVTLPMMAVNFVKMMRRMMMTLKEVFQATIVGLIVSSPFIFEIVKELMK
jgi:hypothetical protein